jgi:serine/threonine-protein phosphatase PGAM5
MLLHLVRHGDAGDDGELTPAGRHQASLLGARLATTTIAAVRHSPLTRAAQTTALIGDHLPGVPLVADETVGDYVPFAPDPLPAFLADMPSGELARGAVLADAAIRAFARPDAAPELIVTHSFLIAWFVRHALGAPPERWLGLNAANAALTVISYRPGRPPSLLTFNDMSHLPPALQWTGFPPALRP